MQAESVWMGPVLDEQLDEVRDIVLHFSNTEKHQC